MKNTFARLDLWLNEFQNFSFPQWDSLPELDLYMDQVISFLEKKIGSLEVAEEKMITSFMINNYVKGGVLEAPLQKKYGRRQLTSLFIICFMKQVITLKDIDLILKLNEDSNETKNSLYEYFTQIHNLAIQQVNGAVTPMIDQVQKHYNDLQVTEEMSEDVREEIIRKELSHVALHMAIQAEVYKIVSQKILQEIRSSKGMELEVDKNELTVISTSDKPSKKERKRAKKAAKKQRKAEKKRAEEEAQSLDL